MKRSVSGYSGGCRTASPLISLSVHSRRLGSQGYRMSVPLASSSDFSEFQMLPGRGCVPKFW